MGSGSERLGGSDVGKRGCSSYRSVLSFRGPEAEQEKLESLVLIGDRIPAIREVKKLAHNRGRHRERSACRTGAACSGVRGGRTIYVPVPPPAASGRRSTPEASCHSHN